MSETDKKLRVIEKLIKELPWDVRVAFISRQYNHAVVNIGPENVRKVADKLVDYIDNITEGTAFESLGDKAEERVHTFKTSRIAHNIGKGLALLGIGIIIVALLWFFRGG